VVGSTGSWGALEQPITLIAMRPASEASANFFIIILPYIDISF